ncbi:MAG TPA: glycosyltransferase [Burkholderiales bacterium]|nr:glycosyltransferase [Burkholderiales bacterium]
MNCALFLTNLAGGGAERSMLRLASVLQRRGHTVRLVLLEDVVAHEIDSTVEVQALGTAISKGAFGKWLGARRLARFLARHRKNDLFVSTLPFADEVAVRARAPNLWCRITNTLSEEVNGLKGVGKRRRRMARYRKIYGGARLIAVSDGVAQDLRGPMGLSDARIVRIYNGFDVAALRSLSLERDPGIPRDPFVLHVGRFARQKRHDVLLDAWKIAGLPMRLVLLSPPDPGLSRLIHERQLDSQVLVAGFRPNPYPWMKAAEMLVLSSEREGMPNVLVEALACGTRVVSTDCPSGPREVLRGALARGLVPVGDARALASAMRSALSTARPGPEDVPPEFSEETMASAYEALAHA